MTTSSTNGEFEEVPEEIDPAAVGRLMRIGGARLLRRIIDLYTSEAVSRLDATLDAVATSNGAGAEAAAHSLKSMAGNVGALRVYAACVVIEEGARRGVGPEVREAAATLTEAHRRACEALGDLRPADET
jgi:two-component system sensor histidine kinase/response regulator